MPTATSPTEVKPAAPPPLEKVMVAFPQLEILELIGHGGMGVVYKARQTKLDRLVGLKLLAQSLAADASFAERFHREARVLARLNHPGIVSVYDYGETGGFFYLIMEYVDGVNLRQAMQAGRFTPSQALALVPKICEALQYAHDEGILHRDVKPENILLDSRGRVKIADFGIAKLMGDTLKAATLTASGQTVGTPHYMAPEMWEHPHEIDQRADIYSLGVVFYEMLTGELPIGRFAPPSEKTPVDSRVDDIVFRALEKEREKRFHNVGEVKTRVEAITAGTLSASAKGAAPAADSVRGSDGLRSVSGSMPAELHSLCYFSTPQRMRHCFPGPAAHIFICKGELVLNPARLTFLTPWQTQVAIPLGSIQKLSIGQFRMWDTPWVMKYERLDYLAVTFLVDNQSRTVHLAPVTTGLTSMAANNPHINAWFDAIRQAVQSATGQEPESAEPAEVSVSAEPTWNRKGWPLLLGGGLALVIGARQLWLSHGSLTNSLAYVLLFIGFLLYGAAMWYSVGFLQANYALKHANLDAVTSDVPPADATRPKP